MRNKIFLQFFLFFTTLTLFSGSIYDEYDNGKVFAKFDTLMNEVRFPTSSPEKMEKWVSELQLFSSEFPTYPKLPSALYFLGQYNLELKYYQAALGYLEEARRTQPDLAKSTPLDRYIEDCEHYLAYRNTQLISSTILIGWGGLILLLLLLRIKRNEIKFKKPAFFGFLTGSFLVLILFSFSTASWSDGMSDLYCPPTLVKSSLWSPGSHPLWLLAFCTIFSCLFVALSAISVKKWALVYSLLTAVVIGGSSTVLYYQFFCYDVADRTGINLPKRVTFEEKIIEWHKDVPDEMLPMYDKKLQLLIQQAKDKAANEEPNP